MQTILTSIVNILFEHTYKKGKDRSGNGLRPVGRGREMTKRRVEMTRRRGEVPMNHQGS